MVRDMARASGLQFAAVLLLCACAVLAESDEELLQLGEGALCRASHSRFTRTFPGQKRELEVPKSTDQSYSFSAFLVIGVRPCSGAVLSASHVITSAYCAQSSDNGMAFAGGKKYQTKQDLMKPYVQLRRLTTFWEFDEKDPDLDHDVVIAQVHSEWKLGEAVNSISLVDSKPAEPPYRANVIAFGEAFSGDHAHMLSDMQVMLESSSTCKDNVHTYHLGDNALCQKRLRETMCWGDMGGPVLDANGKLLALIAYKTPRDVALHQCGQEVENAFYMFIGYYADWILSIVHPQVDSVTKN